MNFSIYLKYMAILIITNVASGYAFSQDILGGAAEIETLKQTIITWSDSLKSFSGEYSISQTNYDHSQGKMTEVGTLSWDIVFRQMGDNFYFKQTEGNDDSEKGTVEVYTMYNGNSSSLLERRDGQSLGVANETERTGLPFPWGVYLTPREIFGGQEDFLLRDVLAQGSSRIIKNNGEYIFSHRNSIIPSAVDITINNNGTIRKIEWARWPFMTPEERLTPYWQGDPFDIRRKTTTLELSRYLNLNGVSFPGSVVKTWWQINVSAAEEVNALFEQGKISQDELEVLLHTTPVQAVCVQSFSLLNAMVNEPLSEEDFTIDWPKGTRIFQARNMPQPGDIIPDNRSLWPYIAVACTIGVLIGVAVLLYYRRHY